MSLTIQNNEFVGVKFTEPASQAIQTLAEALLENARAIGRLADVFKANNITVESLLKLERTPYGGVESP